MYTSIINPITNRKVGIHTKLGQSIINNYLNYIQLGGMHIAMIYIELKAKLKKNNELLEWLNKKRLDKPRGILTFIINKLAEESNDTIIKQKINKLSRNIETIKKIKENKTITELEKKDKILELIDGDLDLDELEDEPIVYCKVCGVGSCPRGVRCGRSYNFEDDN